MENKVTYISVTTLNRYLYYRFDQDAALQEVYLKGEISNFKYSGKHCYFSLKDESSEISAMFFYPANLSLHFVPQDGMSVQLIGKVQVYQKKGSYSIVVKTMVQTGIGVLYQEFLDLKDKLQKEGLFDPARKLPIPEYPQEVAIITAATGEAVHDIISTFNRRFPLAKLKLYPALVQGVDAPKDLMRALREVYLAHTADVIIIGRGGGSFEDLSCFNNEELARLIYESPIPTISAVGHEGDYTICDFVASFRAPTPTGAAMKLTKEKKDVIDLILHFSMRLRNGIKNTLLNGFNQYQALQGRLSLLSPLEVIKRQEEERVNLTTHCQMAFENILQKNEVNYIHTLERFYGIPMEERINQKADLIHQLSSRIEELVLAKVNQASQLYEYYNEKAGLLNPLYLMTKGYAIVYDDNNQIIPMVKNVHPKEAVHIHLQDGTIHAEVTKVEENENGTNNKKL
jgi:exodeoxyribonuclease VII large subunit